MADTEKSIVIKKYANRRLYNTGSSTYVTLEDLAEMVKRGDEFTVQDAKSGDDLTRAVLTQIIFEQEGKDGQNLLPVAFLRQLISFYGDSMQSVVPNYLEMTMNALSSEQDKIREQMKNAMQTLGVPDGAIPGMDLGSIEQQVKQNTEMFQNALQMFMPFGATSSSNSAPPKSEANTQADDIDELKKQLSEMQDKLSKLG